MADEAATTDKPKPVTPLGAQIMRKLHAGLKGVMDECTKMAGPLDACPAKDAIGGIVNGLGGHVGELEKAWTKHYKDFDMAAQDDPDPDATKAEKPASEGEKPAEDAGDTMSDDEIDAALNALADDGDDADPEKPAEKPEEKPAGKADAVADDDDDESKMSDEEKRQALSRIKRLERVLAAD